MDARGYASDAQTVLAHGVIDMGFYRPPLYAYLRAGMSLLGLTSPWVLAVAHAVAGSWTAVLLLLTTFHLVSDDEPRLRLWAARLAGITAALYGPFVMYDVEMLPQAWIDLLVALALFLAVRVRSRSADAMAGLCVGLAGTGWGPALVLGVPLLLLRLQAVVRERSIWAVTTLFIAATLLPVGLSALHNATHEAPGVIISGNLGINLWLGNNPRWRETERARPGIYYDLEFQRPTRAGALTLPERESYYVNQVFDDLKQRPLDALVRTLEKFYLTLHGREIRRDQDLAWLRETSPIAGLLTWECGVRFPFGLLLPFALATPARRLTARTKGIVLSGVLLYACCLAWFILAARYRLVLVTLIVPLAATGVTAALQQAVRALRDKARFRVDGNTLVFVIAVFVFNLPNSYTTTFTATPVERLLLRSQAFMGKQDFPNALATSTQAVEAGPDDADAQLQLGQLLMSAGRPEGAARHFSRVEELVPESEAPFILHGQAMFVLGQYDRAAADFAAALQRNPYQRDALRDIARSHMLAGERELATTDLRRYLEAGYQDDKVARELARRVLGAHGPEATLTVLRALEQRYPHWTVLQELIRQMEGEEYLR